MMPQSISAAHLPLQVVCWLLSLCSQVLVQQRPHAVQEGIRRSEQVRRLPAERRMHHVKLQGRVKLHLVRDDRHEKQVREQSTNSVKGLQDTQQYGRRC
jgi:hypothetical protein